MQRDDDGDEGTDKGSRQRQHGPQGRHPQPPLSSTASTSTESIPSMPCVQASRRTPDEPISTNPEPPWAAAAASSSLRRRRRRLPASGGIYCSFRLLQRQSREPSSAFSPSPVARVEEPLPAPSSGPWGGAAQGGSGCQQSCPPLPNISMLLPKSSWPQRSRDEGVREAPVGTSYRKSHRVAKECALAARVHVCWQTSQPAAVVVDGNLHCAAVPPKCVPSSAVHAITALAAA